MRIVAFILDPQVVTKILRHIASSDTARERAPPGVCARLLTDPAATARLLGQ